MRRREFITLVGGAVGAWPFASRAQQQEKSARRIGVLLSSDESDPEAEAQITAFEDGLRKLGWDKNRNIAIDYRWAGADQRLVRTYAAELVGSAPNLLFVAGVPPLVAAQEQTRSIPIVFVQVSDPVKLGFVTNLARPGGNITGFVHFEHSIGGKWLELLRDIAPGTSRVAIAFDPENSAMSAYLEAIKSAAPSFGMQPSPSGVRNAAEIDRTIEIFAQQPNGALVVLPNAVTIQNRDLIIALTAQRRLPAIYPYPLFASGGGLMSYGVDLTDLYRRCASYVDRILKGEKPGDLPVQNPTKYLLIINLKAAKALGLTIPPTLFARADEVIQ
jgi:putative ABC transport system substrate-binding protein